MHGSCGCYWTRVTNPALVRECVTGSSGQLGSDCTTSLLLQFYQHLVFFIRWRNARHQHLNEGPSAREADALPLHHRCVDLHNLQRPLRLPCRSVLIFSFREQQLLTRGSEPKKVLQMLLLLLIITSQHLLLVLRSCLKGIHH